MSASTNLTKEETKALWCAIDWMQLCLRTPDAKGSAGYEAECERLVTAKRALRKVNAIRKAQAADAKAARELSRRIDMINDTERKKATGEQP